MPVMPVIFLLGLVGMLRTARINSKKVRERIVSRTWAGITALSLVGFWFFGARAYAYDVGVINTEMVRAALWVKENTAFESIIAAHDVGALGYFGERQIRDLAGLVEKDVIPYLWNDAEIAEYLNREGVDYLATFEDWYPNLLNGLNIAYHTRGPYSPLFGMANFAIYFWP
jgi:hypothetical protein